MHTLTAPPATFTPADFDAVRDITATLVDLDGGSALYDFWRAKMLADLAELSGRTHLLAQLVLARPDLPTTSLARLVELSTGCCYDETAQALLPDWTGTVGQLIETCTELAAEVAA